MDNQENSEKVLEETINDTNLVEKSGFSFPNLSDFFICIAVTNLFITLLSFLVQNYIVNYSENSSLLKDLMLYSTIANVLSLILLVLANILPYIYYRKKMKINNEVENVRLLDISIFCIVVMGILSLLSNYIKTTSYNGSGGSTVFLVGLCMFIVGRYINDKILYIISASYIMLNVLITIIRHFYINYLMVNHIYTNYGSVNILITIIFIIYVAAGYLILGLYLRKLAIKSKL